MSDTRFIEWMAQHQRKVETALENNLPAASISPVKLHEAMRYTTLGGGKRVRPLLVQAAGELSGASSSSLDIAACAVECIHVYSLVHDDMPCMDDDSLRRGKPTVHVQYDESTALLVGDALQTLAFDLLSAPGVFPDSNRQLRAIHTLARASGSRGMAGGQAIDLASVGKTLDRAELEHMHIHKTGALIRAAILLGALAGTLDEEQMAKLDHYGKCIGLLFQVVDDILDATADTATLGKTAGKDASHNKPTYVSLMGLTQSRDLARELSADADASLTSFGDAAWQLKALNHYIISRQF